MAQAQEKKKDPLTVLTDKARCSFPAVFEPETFDGKTTYNLTLIFPDSVSQKRYKDALDRAAHEKWGSKLPANLKQPIRPGSDKADTEGYGDGVWFIRTTSKQAPGVVDRERMHITDRSIIYPGCYLRATVRAYAYEYQNDKGAVVSRGVSFGLNNVQWLGDGERLDSRTDPEDDFDEVDDGAFEGGDDSGGGEQSFLK